MRVPSGTRPYRLLSGILPCSLCRHAVLAENGTRPYLAFSANTACCVRPLSKVLRAACLYTSGKRPYLAFSANTACLDLCRGAACCVPRRLSRCCVLRETSVEVLRAACLDLCQGYLSRRSGVGGCWRMLTYAMRMPT
jgi:hypothetical protein